MIVFAALGLHGRLGNQLFQMAATIALARRNGTSFGFPRWSYEGRIPLRDGFYDDINRHWELLYQEPSHAYTPIPYHPRLNLHGYFQSERYFSDCAGFIRGLFRVPRPITPAIFLHVRRGDYLHISDQFPPLEMDYYERALTALPARHYLVFSDDLAWCRTHFLGSQFTFVDEGDELDQLQLMASCAGGILANSSYSWWGAWLSGQSRILAPRIWFGPALAHLNTQDILPERWQRL